MRSILTEGLETEEKELALAESIVNGKAIKFSPKEVIDFIRDNSENVKVMSESFGFDYTDTNKLTYDHNTQLASIKESGESLKVFLEDSLKAEINDFYRNFK